MSRLEGWDVRLAALIERERNEPFVWGSHDCVGFALRAVEAITGAKPEIDLGNYKTALGAARRVKALGFQSLGEAVTSVLGEPLDCTLQARRGDIALGLPEIDAAVGVVIGSFVFYQGQDGLVTRPLRFAALTWRV